jgi:hypothetical protein
MGDQDAGSIPVQGIISFCAFLVLFVELFRLREGELLALGQADRWFLRRRVYNSLAWSSSSSDIEDLISMTFDAYW